MLSVDRMIPGRENAIAPLDVRLLQREHGFAEREASVHVVRHYATQNGKGETFQVEEGLQTFREEVHPGSATLDERFSSV